MWLHIHWHMSHLHTTEHTRARPLGIVPSVVFFLVSAMFWGVAMLCLWDAHGVQVSVAGSRIPESAVCLRAKRLSEYSTVSLAIGSPARVVELLLRLDDVAESVASSVRLYHTRMEESRTYSCDSADFACMDVAYVVHGAPSHRQHTSEIAFSTVLPDSMLPLTRALGLSGDIRPRAGQDVHLSATHACFSDTTDPYDTPEASPLHASAFVTDRERGMKTTLANVSLVDAALLKDYAVRASQENGRCLGDEGENDTVVDVFPLQAAMPSAFLSLVDPHLARALPDALDDRRRVVELGTVCATGDEMLRRPLSLYETDCLRTDSCRDTPSLSYHSVSTLNVHARYGADMDVRFWFERDLSLRALPGIGDTAHAEAVALLTFLLLVLSAAVMWTRADRDVTRARWIYWHCVRVAYGKPIQDSVDGSLEEDAALGLVAASVRLAVCLWRFDVLRRDGQARACFANIAAASLSLASWVARYLCIKPNIFDSHVRSDPKAPLLRLGGSTAVLDATAAVLLAFAVPPLYSSAQLGFYATARLLTGMAICLKAVPRCLYAAAGVSVRLEGMWLAHVVSTDNGIAYPSMLALAAVAWALQLAVIAICLCDLIVSPLTFSMTRNMAGGTYVISYALLCTLLGMALPRLIRTSAAIALNARAKDV